MYSIKFDNPVERPESDFYDSQHPVFQNEDVFVWQRKLIVFLNQVAGRGNRHPRGADPTQPGPGLRRGGVFYLPKMPQKRTARCRENGICLACIPGILRTIMCAHS